MNKVLLKVTSGRIIALGAFALLPLSVAAPHVIALLLPLVAISSAIMHWLEKRSFAPFSPSWLLLIVLFHLWIFASLCWSPLPLTGLQYALKVTLTSLWGMLLLMTIDGLEEDEQGIVRRAFLWGYLATIIIITIYILSRVVAESINSENKELGKLVKINLVRLNRASSLLSLSVWLGLYFLRKLNKPIWLKGIFFIISGSLICYLWSDAAFFALFLSGLCWFSSRIGLFAGNLKFFKYKTFIETLSFTLTVAYILAAPYGITSSGAPERNTDNIILKKKHSYEHRFFIWYDVSNHIFGKPIIGHGFASTRYMRSGAMYPYTEQAGFQIPTHPHNAPLEVWSDLGGVGAILLLLCTLLMMWGIGKVLDKASRSFLVALFIGGFVLCCVSFGFWQIWWLASLWFLGALARVGYKESILPSPLAQKAPQ